MLFVTLANAVESNGSCTLNNQTCIIVRAHTLTILELFQSQNPKTRELASLKHTRFYTDFNFSLVENCN